MLTDCFNNKTVASKLRVEIIQGLDSISDLKADWDDLFCHADNATPFYSRAWVQTFISERKNKGTSILITVWSDSRLVALLPLTIRNYFGIKTAIGTPTDMLCCTGILVDSKHQEAIHLIAKTCIKEKIAHVFYNKYTASQDESTNKLFSELNHHGLVCKRWKRHASLKADLEPDFDKVLNKNRTHEQRKKLLYHERRIFKSGDVRIVRYIGEQITPEVTQRIADIQNDSWVKLEGAAVLDQPFYQKLLIKLGRAGMGRIWLMTKGNEDVAFLYVLRRKDSLYPKWMAYRLKYGSSSLSYGKTMCMQMIRDACNENISKMDFGFGEDKWKELWATDTEDIDMVICGRGFIGRIAVPLFGVLRKCARYKWIVKKRLAKMKKKHK